MFGLRSAGFTGRFSHRTEYWRSTGIGEVVSAPASPWQNPYVERLIGSIRRECLDHVIVLNASHLRRILTMYSRYYHRSRTHLGLEKDAPDPRPISPASAASVIAIPEVGGLHHRYEPPKQKPDRIRWAAVPSADPLRVDRGQPVRTSSN